MTAVHPADYEAMSLLRATTNEFIATGANVYNDPKGSTAPPYGPTAYSTWGTPIDCVHDDRLRAGRPDLRWHDLRHTGAVLAAQTGATLAELMVGSATRPLAPP